MGVRHEALNLSKGKRVRGPIHIQTVNNRHSRLKRFLTRYNGVSTKYLQNYLRWFERIELVNAPPRLCLATAIEGQPHTILKLSVLYLLKAKHEEEYWFIRNTIRRIAPFFDDFVLEPRSLNENRIRLEWRHRGKVSYFDVSRFSDGTLRFIALTVLLLQPDKCNPSVILLDEPELGLHPSAITVLGALVRHASRNVQAIISTQSPMLLDMFKPEEVVVVQNDEGASTFTRLDKSDLGEWLEEYSLSELWEKNEIGGKPGGNYHK